MDQDQDLDHDEPRKSQIVVSKVEETTILMNSKNDFEAAPAYEGNVVK